MITLSVRQQLRVVAVLVAIHLVIFVLSPA